MSHTNPLHEKRKNGFAARLVAAGALMATVGFGAPAEAMDRIARIDEILSGFAADVMADNAAEIGEALLPETLGYCVGDEHLFVSTRFERTESFSLDDMEDGLDLEYVFHDREILPTGYYTHRIEVADPTMPVSPSTHLFVNADGETVAEGEGTYDFFGQIPDRGETRGEDCETTAGRGIDENGEECINMVTICDDGENIKIMQACLKAVD